MMSWHGKQIAAKVRKAGIDGLRDASEYLLEEADRIVPHRKGALEASGTVSLDESSLTASVFYDTPYARRLHEHPEYRFRKGRKGKWLEITFKDKGSRAQEYIRDKIAKALRG